MSREILESGMVMRTLQGEVDQAAFVAFNARSNNPSEGATCQCLISHHPKMNDDHFFIVEDERNNQIAACLCLIPWEMNFDGVSLKAAMMEMVLSHPDYRRMGLVKKLIRKFQEEVVTCGFDLTLITGIPNYYRQFGYAYALDLAEGVKLGVERIRELERMPEDPGKGSPLAGISFRRVSVSDIPELHALRKESMKSLQVFFNRDEAYWRYLLEGARYDIRMLDDSTTGETLGYAILKREGGILCVMESGMRCDVENEIRDKDAAETRTKDAAKILLRCLINEVGQEIRIYAHPHDKVRQVAMEWGAALLNNDQWLLKVEDQVALLTRLIPAFESRIDKSPMPGFTKEVIINQFRQAIGISIACGKITEIRSLGFVDSSMGADGGDLCIPADAFLRLLFGYRSLEQLWDAWPDTVVRESSRELLGILFPKMEAHLLGIYHYQGEIG
jgi:predicted acetyltransferase